MRYFNVQYDFVGRNLWGISAEKCHACQITNFTVYNTMSMVMLFYIGFSLIYELLIKFTIQKSKGKQLSLLSEKLHNKKNLFNA